MNGKKISEETKIKKLHIYLTQIGEYQAYGYKYIIDNLRGKKSKQKLGFKGVKAFGYSDLQLPIEALNIVYPYEGLEKLANKIENIEFTEEEEDIDDIENIEKIEQSMEGGTFKIIQDDRSEEVSSNNNSDIDISNDENDSESDSYDEEEESEATYEVEHEQKELEESEEEKEYSFGKKITTKIPIQSETKPSKIEESKKIISLSKSLYKIDPKEIVGKQGLRRVMKYEDTMKPLFKGNFSYKKGYENIFHPEKIGKYSAKIQAICNSIYNRNTNVVSDGIIIIYSNYIDGGLVPMALALEEM